MNFFLLLDTRYFLKNDFHSIFFRTMEVNGSINCLVTHIFQTFEKLIQGWSNLSLSTFLGELPLSQLYFS